MKVAPASVSNISVTYPGSVSEGKVASLKCAVMQSLASKGLDRLTDSRVEQVLCTSALAAFY